MIKMSSEDELDYMSDKFLAECVKDDIRPSLLKSHSQKHQHKVCKKKLKTDEKNKRINPSHKLMEAEKREDGLNQPLASDNIGFKMMQKLGFQPGTALGKSGTGRIEPIPIAVKTDRKGLGRQAALKEIEEMKAKRRHEAREKQTNVTDYRAHLMEQAAEKKAVIDLRQSQRACRDLDEQNNIQREEVWFWPEEFGDKIADKGNADSSDTEDSNEDDNSVISETEEFTVREKLEMLTKYLRETYFYCVWCGTIYENYADLKAECPGSTRQDH